MNVQVNNVKIKRTIRALGIPYTALYSKDFVFDRRKDCDEIISRRCNQCKYTGRTEILQTETHSD